MEINRHNIWKITSINQVPSPNTGYCCVSIVEARFISSTGSNNRRELQQKGLKRVFPKCSEKKDQCAPSVSDHSCEVWSKSNKRFQRRCCLKKLLTDARTHAHTDNGRRTYKDHKSSLSTSCSGELN